MAQASHGSARLSITFKDIKAASRRISGKAVRTPIIRHSALDGLLSARAFIKPENLQRTGSFKFRGAYNRLSQLNPEKRRSGVVAWSSGNHAQGIAAAGQLLEIPTTIVMPADAPATKMQKTRSFGARVLEYDRFSEDREEIGRTISEETGAVLVPSYDDPDIMAGQGTAGLEFAEQVADLDVRLDTLLVCCGGGGLIAGMSTAFRSLSAQTDIYCVEPEAFNDHQRSLELGERVENSPDARSICDALLAPTPGALTFPINSQTLDGGLAVSDDEVKQAMRFAFDTLKLVVEPGGAVALAAALSHKIDLTGKNVGIVISGGNVDAGMFSEIIAGKC